jgi:hypothetical protein
MPSGPRSVASLNKHTITGLKHVNNGTFTFYVGEDVLKTSGVTFQTGFTATQCLIHSNETTLDSLTPHENLKMHAISQLAVDDFNTNTTSTSINGLEYSSSTLTLSDYDTITGLGGIHKTARLTLKPTSIAVAAGTTDRYIGQYPYYADAGPAPIQYPYYPDAGSAPAVPIDGAAAIQPYYAGKGADANLGNKLVGM